MADPELELSSLDSLEASSAFPLDDAFGVVATPSTNAPVVVTPSTRIGRFAVLRKLGQGGMGMVYSAYDEELDRRVALKLMRKADEAATRRMWREAQAMARIAHPNVAGIHEVGTWEEQLYLAIEFIEGQTLREWLEQGPTREAIYEVMLQAARGLEAAHAAGLVHRDFKPDNVMVGKDGRVRVLDFGLAGADLRADVNAPEQAKPRAFQESLTMTGTRMGTPAYMSPEQFAGGETGPACDQFSYCVSLYEALYGTRPFLGTTLASYAASVTEGLVLEPAAGTRAPPAIHTLILRGLATDPAERHADMRALIDAFEHGLGSPARRRRRWFGAIGLALASVASIVGYFSWVELRARAAANAKRAASQTLVAREAKDEAKAAARAQRNALLIAVARGFPNSPTEASAMLREVRAPDPLSVLGWAPTARPLSADPRPLIAKLEGHEDQVLAVDFSPDGSLLATGSLDGSVRVWTLDGSRAPVVLEAQRGGVNTLHFSPDGSLLASWGRGPRLLLWPVDLDTGEIGEVRELVGHDKGGRGLAFSPDGKWLASSSNDFTIRVWSTESSTVAQVLRGHSMRVNSVAFSPDGSLLASASRDKSARIWRLEQPGEVIVLDGHPHELDRVAFSPDGTQIVTSGHAAHIWTLDAQGEPKGEPRVLAGHQKRILSLAFSPDSSRLLTASKDGTARIWPLDEPGPPQIFSDHERPISRGYFSPDGSQVLTVSADRTARVWRADGSGVPVVLGGHEDEVLAGAFSPDGAWVATTSWDRKVRVFDLRSNSSSTLVGRHESGVWTAEFSPDDTRVVSGSSDRSARLWLRDGSELRRFEGLSSPIYSAVFSPEGERLLLGLGRGARIETLDPGTEPIVFPHPREVRDARFDPKGQRIATACLDGVARIWQADGSEPPLELRGHTSDVHAVAFGPRGERVITGSGDRSARIWQLDDPRAAIVLEGHEGQVHAVAFSPSGELVVTGSHDRSARVWSVDGTPTGVVLRGHEDKILSAVWSPDGTQIATSSDDGSARIWSADGQGEPLILEAHTDLVWDASYSTDGTHLVTASWDFSIRIWDLARSAQDLRTRFWQDPFCHSAEARVRLLGETTQLAERHHAECLELTRLCTHGNYEDCHREVLARFGP